MDLNHRPLPYYVARNEMKGKVKIFIGGADTSHKKPALIFAPLAQIGLIRVSIFLSLCAQMDLNHRPLPYKGSALTAELWAHKCE